MDVSPTASATVDLAEQHIQQLADGFVAAFNDLGPHGYILNAITEMVEQRLALQSTPAPQLAISPPQAFYESSSPFYNLPLPTLQYDRMFKLSTETDQLLRGAHYSQFAADMRDLHDVVVHELCRDPAKDGFRGAEENSDVDVKYLFLLAGPCTV